MKKTVVLVLFTIWTTFIFANTNDPKLANNQLPPSGIDKSVKSEEFKPVEGCTYCSACKGIIVCVTCPCDNCGSALNALQAALCTISPYCCYDSTPK